MAAKTRTTLSERRIADTKKKMGKYLPGMGDDFDWWNPFDYPGAIVGGAMDAGGMINDAVRGDIMGDVNYDRDWTWDDGISLAGTALTTVPGVKAGINALKGAGGVANAASKGGTKVYNTLTGASRKAPQIPTGKKKPKVDLDNPGGKNPKPSGKNEIVKYDPKVAAANKAAAKGGAKGGVMNSIMKALRRNPKTALIAGGLGALGLNNYFDDDEEAPETPSTPAIPDTSDNTDTQGEETGPQEPKRELAGQTAAAAADAVNSRPRAKDPLGTGKQRLAKQYIDRANREAKIAGDNQIKDSYVQRVADDRDRDFRDAYNRSAYGHVEHGDFDSLSPEKQAELRKQYVQSKRGGAYDSSVDAAQKRRAQTLQDIEASGSYYVDPNDPTNNNQASGQVSREEFMKRSGLQNPGTFLTQNADGTYNTGETGEAFERAGGIESARQQLMPEGQGQGSMSMSRAMPATLANIENQVGGDNSFTYADGSQGPAMNKGSIRTPSNMQDYGDAAFKSRDEALAYLNRKGAAPTPAPAPAPEEGGDSIKDTLMRYAPLALLPLTRGKGPKMYPGRPGTPFPKGNAPTLNPGPTALPNRGPAGPGLPNNPRGLPNNLRQLDDKLPRGLANNQMTPHQFRRAQRRGIPEGYDINIF